MVETVYLLFAVAKCNAADAEDVGCSNVSATNGILLSLLTDRLQDIHDVELPLCEHDTADIVRLLCDDSALPLPSSPTMKLRCYVRLLTSSHLVVTLIPASYDDMVAAMSMFGSLGFVVDSAADGAVGLAEDRTAGSVTQATNTGVEPAAVNQDLNVLKTGGETGDAVDESSRQDNAEVDTSTRDDADDEPVTVGRPCNVCLPVFVFDCVLKLVSDQLVHRSTSDRPPDIVEDFTYQVMTAC